MVPLRGLAGGQRTRLVKLARMSDVMQIREFQD